MILGEIEKNKPRELIKKEIRKDTKRYLRATDIEGATAKEQSLIPESILPSIHPNYLDKDQQKDLLTDMRHIY
jgi:hypothetical protein